MRLTYDVADIYHDVTNIYHDVIRVGAMVCSIAAGGMDRFLELGALLSHVKAMRVGTSRLQVCCYK